MVNGKKRILVTGANGQLGSELREISLNYPEFEFAFTDIGELDITNQNELKDFFSKYIFEFIINCAAFTAVDKAETEFESAKMINTLAPAYLASACKHFQMKLIHISTDFVFDGKSHIPYKEEYLPNPLSVYGTTKLKGENQIIEMFSDYIILRTSWLYSSYGNNFVKTMLKYGRERGKLNVVFDQIGSPTYAYDLAVAIMQIISQSENEFKSGIYHYSNEGVCSWYDFAKFIIHIANINCTINPIKTEAYPTAAKRPAFSVLDKSKIKESFNLQIPHWYESLEICLKKII